MTNKSSILRKIFLPLLILIVMGCNLPTGLTPTPAGQPTAEETSVFASTISAAQTQAVELAFQSLTQEAILANPAATVTLRPTATSNFSATPVASFTPPPTITPAPPITSVPANQSVPITGATSAPSRTPTQGAYQCKIKSLSPAYGTNLTRGVDFDLRVKLENVGTETWEAGDNDFAYISGAEFQTGVDALDLHTDVDPDEEVTFVIDMAADTGTGTQSARWRLGNFCTVFISVYVIP